MRPEKEAHGLAIPSPQSDYKTFASNKYNHMMDQPTGLEKNTVVQAAGSPA
jgi:hypothetical protein